MKYKGIDYGDPLRGPDRRFRMQPRRGFQISKVWESHAEIARRIVLGEKNVDIAQSMGISSVTVSNVRNSPIMRDRIEVMKGARDAATVDIARDIREFAPKALKFLKEIVNGEGAGADASVSLRAKEANGFLDRAGFVPIRKEQHVHAHLTSEEIEEIKKRAGQTRLPPPDEVVEGELVESAEQEAASL